MNTTDLRRLLREEADSAGCVVPETSKIIAAARRRRRRRVGLGAAALGMAAGGITLGLINTNSARPGSATLLPVSTPGRTTQPSPPASRPPQPAPTFAPLLPAAWTMLSPEPDTTLGLVGAGAERIAVLSASDGHIIRYLPGAGSQTLLSRYGSTLLQPTIDSTGCRNVYHVVDPATGALTPPPAELPGMAELATGSTPRRIAFDQHRPAGRYDEIVNGRRVTVLGGCGASPVDLYVSDPAQGTLRRWTGSNDRGLYPSLNAQGLQVAFNLDGHVRLLDVNGPERTLDQAPVLATPATCTVTGLMYQPGSENLLWVAQTCPSGTYLATYDTVTKRQRRNFQVADSASKVNIGSFDVKPDGEIVGTLSTFSGDGVDGRIFIISNAELQQLPVSGVYQILW